VKRGKEKGEKGGTKQTERMEKFRDDKLCRQEINEKEIEKKSPSLRTKTGL